MTPPAKAAGPLAPAVLAGQAAAAAAEVEAALAGRSRPDRGRLLRHRQHRRPRRLGLPPRDGACEAQVLLRRRDVAGFAWDQVKFRLSGSRERRPTWRDATEVALSFVAGHEVTEVVQLGREIFDERIVGKVYPQTLALARGHLDAGQRVWLVSAAPVELATIIAKRLGLTGALGTVSEIVGRRLHRPPRGPSAARSRQGRGRTCSRRARGARPRALRGVLRLQQRHPDAVPRRPSVSPSTPTSGCASTPATWAGGSTTTGPGARPRRSACPAQPRPAPLAGIVVTAVAADRRRRTH